MRRNLLLAFASIVIFFGVLEAALRLSGRVPTDQLRSPDVRTLDRIPGLYDPGQDYVDRVLPDLPYRVRINSLGFRGAEFPRKKAPGTVRVLCLGDSYTFGPHVEDDQTFPAALERALSDGSTPGPARVEVINGGASGFSIHDELIFLRDKAFALEPDIVILVFCQNDVADLARPQPMIETMREHAGLKSAFVLGPVLKLLQRSAIFNGMQRAAAMLKVRRMRAASPPADRSTPEGWRRYREELERFAELVRERGAKLLMVVWMSANQLSGRSSMAPQETLAGFAGELGLEMVDLAPTVRQMQADGISPFFIPKDGHPNAKAYEAAARATARKLADLGYLAPAPSRP